MLNAQKFGCTCGTQEGSGAGGERGVCMAPLSVSLEVVASTDAGYARISWSGIPRTVLEKGVVLMLYSNSLAIV